jgi:hypothetical protein
MSRQKPSKKRKTAPQETKSQANKYTDWTSKDHYRDAPSGKGTKGLVAQSWIWKFCWKLKSDKSCIVCGFEKDGVKCGNLYSAAATSSVQKHLKSEHGVTVDARTGDVTSGVKAGNPFTDARPRDVDKFWSSDDGRTRALALLLVLDYRCAIVAIRSKFHFRSLTVPHTPSFRRFCYKLCKNWDVPAKETLAESIKQLHREMVANLMAALNEAQFVSVTADSWTSDAGHGYVGMTAHWIDSHWQLQSCCLDVRQFTGLTREISLNSSAWRLPNGRESETIFSGSVEKLRDQREGQRRYGGQRKELRERV